MKLTIDIDCTPEEARAFLGLPDVKPMQDSLLAEVEARMKSNLAAMDPETLARTWMPMGVQGFEQLQKMFWNRMAGGSAGTGESSDERS